MPQYINEVATMKLLLVAIYATTGLIALSGSWLILAPGIYGLRFNWVAAFVLLTSIAMIVGALCRLFDAGNWVRWIPLIASATILTYFLIVVIVIFHGVFRGQPNVEWQYFVVPVMATVFAALSLMLAIVDTRRKEGASS